MEIPYGKQPLSFAPAPERLGLILQSSAPPTVDVAEATQNALWHPNDETAPLAERIRPQDTVAIVVSDITRGWIPTTTMLHKILEVLGHCGIRDQQITVIVAIGSHRPLTPTEISQLVSQGLYERLRVINHHCEASPDLVPLGTSQRGTPIALNRHYMEADCRILTGGITYHFMSGFSGGRKSILPGIAAYKTIQANHCMLLASDSPGTYGCGKLDLNPVHKDMMEVAGLAKPTFLINAIPGADRTMTQVVGGNWDSAWQLGTELVAQQYGIPLAIPAAVVIASPGGYPLDINMYQAVKALINGAEAVQPEGGLILVAQCPHGTGAADFSHWLDYPDLATMEAALREAFTVPGFIAYTMRSIAQCHPTALVSELPLELARKTGMVPHDSIQEALSWLDAQLGEGPIHILPQGNMTLPILVG